MTKPWLWIDDERVPLKEFQGTDDWAKTSVEAIRFMKARKSLGETYEAMFFDHDLGLVRDDEPDTTRPIIHWMIRNNFWPDFIRIHSHNPIGAKWLENMANRYAPTTTKVIREVYRA